MKHLKRFNESDENLNISGQEISDRDFLEQKLVVAEQVSALLNNPKDLIKAVSKLIDERDALIKKLEFYST
jgi:fructose-specific phosphotransferase system component IIB